MPSFYVYSPLSWFLAQSVARHRQTVAQKFSEIGPPLRGLVCVGREKPRFAFAALLRASRCTGAYKGPPLTRLGRNVIREMSCSLSPKLAEGREHTNGVKNVVRNILQSSKKNAKFVV